MHNDGDIVITITFMTNDTGQSGQLVVPVDVYFDDEIIELDALPQFEHAVDYIDVVPARLLWTELVLHELSTGHRVVILEWFWSGGRNRIIDLREDWRGVHHLTVCIASYTDPEPHEHILQYDAGTTGRGLEAHVLVFNGEKGDELRYLINRTVPIGASSSTDEG